jgi:hypothetical protein
VPSTPRDKDATWRTPGSLCRELDWPWGRLCGELIAGRAFYRTYPPYEIDWGDPTLRFDGESTVTILHRHSAKPGVRGFYKTVDVEVSLPPTDVSPAPAPSLLPTAAVAASSPPASPRKNVSEAEVERCFRDIMKERPDDPPDEEWLLAEMTRRLGASPGRQRLRNMWKTIAPEWKRPVGHPRNFISAKKSAE